MVFISLPNVQNVHCYSTCLAENCRTENFTVENSSTENFTAENCRRRIVGGELSAENCRRRIVGGELSTENFGIPNETYYSKVFLRRLKIITWSSSHFA